MNCEKRVFETYDEAKKALKAIKASHGYKEKEKKEQRPYRCPFCDKYHLTSISERDNSLYHKAMQERQQKRIERVSSYWEQKLGIKKDG